MSTVYGKQFAPIYDQKWSFFSEELWPFLCLEVRRLRPEATTWLDVCCGTGTLLRHAVDAGFQVTGVDRSPAQLAFARRNSPGARVVRSDVRDLDLGRGFDVITCLFDSLNYLTRKRDLERAFRRCRRHLTPRGLFLFDMNTWAGLKEVWQGAMVIREPGYTVVTEASFDEGRALGRCVITGFVKEGRRFRRFEEEHVERGYRPEEIDDSLRRAGLRFRKRDGVTQGRPRQGSIRLLYTAYL